MKAIMKIGEYFVSKNYISRKDLNKALELQKQNKNLRVGEILVKTGAVSPRDLRAYVIDFMIQNEQSDLEKFLSQNQINELIECLTNT